MSHMSPNIDDVIQLTEDMVDLMGGIDSDLFRYYKSLLLKGLRNRLV